MPDSMQVDAMERLKQMYSKAQPNSKSAPQNAQKHSHSDTDTAPQESKNEPQLHNGRRDNLLDIFMQDKEKSLIVLLISEKADSTLILALMYLIL